jgi:hypothetical protein
MTLWPVQGQARRQCPGGQGPGAGRDAVGHASVIDLLSGPAEEKSAGLPGASRSAPGSCTVTGPGPAAAGYGQRRGSGHDGRGAAAPGAREVPRAHDPRAAGAVAAAARRAFWEVLPLAARNHGQLLPRLDGQGTGDGSALSATGSTGGAGCAAATSERDRDGGPGGNGEATVRTGVGVGACRGRAGHGTARRQRPRCRAGRAGGRQPRSHAGGPASNALILRPIASSPSFSPCSEDA